MPAERQTWSSTPQDDSVKALKMTLKYMLSGEKSNLSYSDLCTLLAVVANMVNKQPVALWSLADDEFMPLTVNLLLLRKTPEASVEHHDDLEEQCFGASNYQQDLLVMWWKRWKDQGFASLLPYNGLKKDKRHANNEVGIVCLLNLDNKVCGTNKLCRVLTNKISTSGKSKSSSPRSVRVKIKKVKMSDKHA